MVISGSRPSRYEPIRSRFEVQLTVHVDATSKEIKDRPYYF